MDPEIIQNHYGLGARTFALEIFNEGREGAHIVTACENRNRDEAVLEAESTNDRYGLASLVRHLDSHAGLDPYSRRRHPEMKRRFIYIYNVCIWFRH